MSLLLTILVYLIVLGVVYWLITAVVPMPPQLRTVALVIFALLVIVVLIDLVAGGPLGLPALR